MKYLSFDIEATGLDEHDYMIEFGAVPFDIETRTIEHDLSFHFFIKCPPFEELKSSLNPWVIEHNQGLIEKANREGLEITDFKSKFENYLESKDLKKYFSMQTDEKITLFGKSMSAIDLPFLNRDLSWNFMRDHFCHRQLDLSSMAYGLIDLGFIPPECTSGGYLMNYLGMGDVCHTALEDAVNTAEMYLRLLSKVSKK